MTPSLRGALLGLLGFGSYAFSDATIKFLGAGYSAVQISAYAGLMTLPLLGLLWLHDREPLRVVHPVLMAIRTVALVTNGLLVTYAFTTLPLAEAYAIFFTMPLLITLMAWPLLGERIDPVAGLAVVIGLVGVLVALDPRGATLGIAHLAAIIAAMGGAVHYLILRKTGGVESRVAMFLYPLIGQTLVALMLLPGRYQPMPGSDLAFVGGLTLAGFIGTLLLIAAYRAAPPIVVAPTQYSQIAWAALFGAVLFDEVMTPRSAIGMLIIAVAGMMVVARHDRRIRKPVA
jgi:S-adenosylmethionine uptake transporter